MKWSRILKNKLQPIAANLLQNRHTDRFGADIAMAKPNDQITRAMVKAKKIRFETALGFIYIVYIPKNRLTMQIRLKLIVNRWGMLTMVFLPYQPNFSAKYIVTVRF